MKNNIRRILPVIMIIVLAMTMCLTGCGGNQTAIKGAAEGVLKALQDGDIEKVTQLTGEDALTDGDFSFVGQMGNLSEYFINALGTSEEELSEESKAAIDKLADTLISEYVTSYEMGEVTEEDGVGYVSCSVTYGYSPDALEESKYESEVSALANQYTKDNMEELVEYYNANGQEALSKKIINAILPDICDIILKYVTETEGETINGILKVENIDNTWLVTEAKVAE